MARRGVSERPISGFLLAAFCFALVPLGARAQSLGTAESFAVLGDTTVTCTGSTILGDVGVASGAVLACDVLGATHAGDTVALQAYADFLVTHDDIAAEPCDQVLAGSLAGLSLIPGIYCIDPSGKAGVLTLDGPADGIWIFKVVSGGAGPLVASGFRVVTSGGNGCTRNVYWWTDGYATLTNTDFFGSVLAGTYATVTGGSVKGQALAKGPVTLTDASIRLDFCPVFEVSPSYAVFPARLVKDNASPTGTYLYFQKVDSATGYNVYEGTLGGFSPYSHANTAGNVCGVAAADCLGTGEMRASVTPSTGDHYYLITAYGGGDEGPSGFATPHQEIDPAQSTCAP